MKIKFAIVSALILICSISISAKKSANIGFFSKTDAPNWTYVIKDKAQTPSSVFKMDNGILQITGISSGYLRTKKTYSNYELNLEWRWTKSLGNSGVLVHIQPKDTIWPVCYQVQQKADAAGDIICMNGLWAKECTDSVKFTVKKSLTSNEKPLGEWNSMKVICKKKTLKVFINGVLQNSITGLTVDKGFIGFQNEGVPLEFRNLVIK
ncbi:MAG: DUF1080 domain-containing protein [Paludibacter sp.]